MISSPRDASKLTTTTINHISSRQLNHVLEHQSKNYSVTFGAEVRKTTRKLQDCAIELHSTSIVERRNHFS